MSAHTAHTYSTNTASTHLSERVRAQIRLKAEGFDRWQIRVHRKQRSAGFRQFGGDVATTPLQHIVDGLDGIGGGLGREEGGGRVGG